MRSSPRMELAHGTGRSTVFSGDALARVRFRLLVFFGVGLVDISAFNLSSVLASTFYYIRLFGGFQISSTVMCVLRCRTKYTKIQNREEIL